MKKSQILVSLVSCTFVATVVVARIADDEPEPIVFPPECIIGCGDGGKFPALDQAYFEKLSELNCPDLRYKLPGYYSTDVEERRFIVYWDWRGGTAGSSIGVCEQSRRANLEPAIPSQYKCYFPNPNSQTEIFDKIRRKIPID
ncbi:MAG TPA: hypothetical protein VEL47_02120 [Myxococcota bacterium]|nr:hypothetical protein [Myxococcota bacterium]